MTQLVRCFIAIPLPQTTRTEIGHLQTRLRPALHEVRWTDPDNLHLTLRFLGEQAEDSLEKLGALMLSVGASSDDFLLTFSGIGAFPSWHRGRIVWLGIQPPELVSQLHRKLSEGLQHLGIPKEPRPFHPHLTLGRCRRPTALPPLPDPLLGQTVAACRVDRLVLYRSHLTSHGARHTEISSVRLNA